MHLNKSRVELEFEYKSGAVWRVKQGQCAVKLVLDLCIVLEHAQKGGRGRKDRECTVFQVGLFCYT